MPRLGLVGQSFALRSPAAASQTCVNLYAEVSTDPNEKAKGIGALHGAPGKHLWKDLTAIDAGATPYRGSICVNGHLFVVAGTKFFEIDATGALVGSIFTVTYDSANPTATLYTNGGPRQIMIISANLCHMFDGFSMNIIDLPPFSGTVITDGKTIYWLSGDDFDSSMVGQPISIHSTFFTVDQVTGPHTLTLLTTVARSITAGTNATPTELTSTAHGLSTGNVILISGATGLWTPLNSVWVVTVTGANTFTVGLNATTFGAFTGTVILDYYNTPYQSTIPHMLSSSGTVLDGYFIVSRTSSTKFNISPLFDGGNNGTWVWEQLDFANKESTPGFLRSVLAANEQLYLFGVDGFEVWQNTGNPDFPFERINGATSNVGSISRWGPIDIAGKVFFLGGSAGRLVAYQLNGFTPIRVSTHAEESAWNAASLGVNCISSWYLEEGHSFWQIDFGAQTWVYDLATGLWSQRYKWSGSAFTAYGRAYHIFAENSTGSANDWGVNGKHLVGGDGTGKIYEQSANFYDDVGANIKFQRALPYVYNEGKRIYFSRMTLEMETGTVASGAEPVISRDYSDDRGRSWSTPVDAGVGVHDQFARRVYWPTGGSSYNRVWRLSGVGQSKVSLVTLDCDIALGAN